MRLNIGGGEVHLFVRSLFAMGVGFVYCLSIFLDAFLLIFIRKSYNNQYFGLYWFKTKAYISGAAPPISPEGRIQKVSHARSPK